jgi:hypothetical protein
MKNLLSLPPILGSNIILGGAAGLYGVVRLSEKPDFEEVIRMPFCGVGLGFINGLKFEAISAITDYFKPRDNTAIKAVVNLGIDVISGVLAYALATDNIALGAGVFGTLFVMDTINFVIESYMENPECVELANNLILNEALVDI